MSEDLVYRLHKRADIRRQIPGRKSVQEGKPDRIADLFDEAGREITQLRAKVKGYEEGTHALVGIADYREYLENKHK